MKKISAILLALIMMLSMVAMADTTGTITITNASQGQTYTAYKVFDAHYNESTKTTSYTVKAGAVKDAAAAATTLFVVDSVADSEGNYAVSLVTGASETAVLDWVKANSGKFTQVAQKTATSDTVVFDVPFGYYYITSSLGTTVTVDTNTPAVEVIDKNTTAPSIPDDLKVANDDTAKIGDTVGYTVAYKATNFVTSANGTTTQITEYTVTDTPTSLDIDTATIKIMAGEKDITTTATITEAADGQVSIVIPWATEDEENEGEYISIYDSPIDLTITYNAVVTSTATDKASNKVEVKYNETSFGNDTVEIETYTITVNKVDGQQTPLTGAEFELYDAKTGGNKIALVKDGEFYRPATDEEKKAEGFVSAIIEAGSVEIKGLDGDVTYYLEEIKAPEGYNKLTERVAVTFVNGEGEAAVMDDATSNVVNNSGSELPSTGGIGTTIFYTVGGLMMAAAIVLLVAKKKVAASK